MWILCLAEDSLETSSLIFSEKTMKKYLRMSSAAVVIGVTEVPKTKAVKQQGSRWDGSPWAISSESELFALYLLDLNTIQLR